MTDQEKILDLGKIVFDNNSQERKLWSSMRQTCSRSLIVFLSRVFVISLSICGRFWKIYLSKFFDESTVWLGISCSVAGYILPSPRL